MTTREKLDELEIFVGYSLQNADGLSYPYNLGKIKKMIKAIISEQNAPGQPRLAETKKEV